MNPFRDLARTLAQHSPAPQCRWRRAVVQAVTGTTLTIRLGGSTVDITGVRKLAGPTAPIAGDTVECLVQGPDILVLGKLS